MINSLLLIYETFTNGYRAEALDLISLASIGSTSHEIPLESCDKISGLLSDFNKLMTSLDKETVMDVSTNNNWKEFVNYWLYGTATKNNWFDQGCYDAWDYLKAACNSACSTTSAASNSCHGSYEELTVSDNRPNYLFLGLGCLLIGCAMSAKLYYNLDMLKDVYTSVDIYLYNILCIFDYPGFMVKKRSVMRIAQDLELSSEHFWDFLPDPADNILGLVHLERYFLWNEYFALELALLPPAWSVPNYAGLIIQAGLDWPYNYDHAHNIDLSFILPFFS